MHRLYPDMCDGGSHAGPLFHQTVEVEILTFPIIVLQFTSKPLRFRFLA